MDEPDGGADPVLLLGPLYHLTERADRVVALREAHRALRAGGVGILIGICRFASAFDGLFAEHLADDLFARIGDQDLRDGQYRNPSQHFAYFTTAYFHRPGELRDEAVEAGFVHEHKLAVEGPGWLLRNVEEQCENPARRRRLFDLLRVLESEPSIIGVSAHVMAVVIKA